MDTPHIQHNTRPTVCGTVNISCGPCAPCAIAIPTKSLGKFPLNLLSTTLKNRNQSHKPSENLYRRPLETSAAKFSPNKSPISPSQPSKTATEKKEREKKFLTYYN
jgi:hypothetical protein